MELKFKVLAVAVGILVVMVLALYAYLAFFPHDTTVTLTGYEPPPQANGFYARGGQAAP
jgi:hypothetical protein